MKPKYIALFLFACAAFQPLFGQTGLVLINRSINGTEAQPRTNFITHTFVALVENGRLLETASWGVNGLWGSWKQNWGQDLNAFPAAMQNGWYEMVAPGANFAQFNAVLRFIESSIGHPNLGIILNCKWQAWSFTRYLRSFINGQPLQWDDPASAFPTMHYFAADPFNMSQAGMWEFIRSRLDIKLMEIMRTTDSWERDRLMAQYIAQKMIEDIQNQHSL